MEVIAQGTPTRWTADVACTGKGNGGFGCNSILRVNTDDLRYYAGTDYPICRSPAVSMKCPVCGKVTDLDQSKWPSSPNNLKLWSNAWAEGKEDG